jgi:hypothetical protein
MYEWQHKKPWEHAPEQIILNKDKN